MTRSRAGKRVPPEVAAGRLVNARAFREAAHATASLADPGANGNPIVVQVVMAAIAYADALTARFAGEINQGDHSALPRALRSAMGTHLPTSQERRLIRILDQKDAAQYGGRVGRLSDAMTLFAELDEFANWAETALAKDA